MYIHIQGFNNKYTCIYTSRVKNTYIIMYLHIQGLKNNYDIHIKGLANNMIIAKFSTCLIHSIHRSLNIVATFNRLMCHTLSKLYNG